MTKPTPHGQVPEALIDLIDAYAETRHRCGGVYNAKTEAARKAVIEALSGVQALSAAPVGFVPVAAFDRLHAHAESLAARLLAASPTPPAEQQAPTLRRVARTTFPSSPAHRALHAFVSAMHDNHIKGDDMRAAMLWFLGYEECDVTLQQAAPKAAPVTQQAGYAEVIECGNSYAKVKLKGEAFGSARVGDIFYTALQQDEPVGEVVSASCDHATVRWLHQTSSVGGGDPRNSRAWPKVSGVSRDEGHSRALLVFFAAEPTDDEMRAVHDTLAASPTPPAEQAAPKAAPVEQDDHQILAITTAYEQGVGKGHQAYNSGKEIANPYSPAYRCDLAWQYGYKEGKEQAQREAKAAPQQEAQEPVAWESTTPGYIKYITQARYEKFSPAVRRWYKPYRCSGCAERGAGFDACDMATAAAQGFRRGQAAAKQEG